MCAYIILILTMLLRFSCSASVHNCIKNQPKITIDGVTLDPNAGKYVRSYGDDIIVYCVSEDGNVEIKKDDKLQNTNPINKTAVRLYDEKPDIGVYKYSCAAKKCEDTILVTVKPAVFVKANEVKRQFDEDYGILMNFIQIGSYYEVFCFGNNVEDLQLLLNNNNRIPLQIEMVNGTTLKCKEIADKELDKAYFCKRETGDGEKLEAMTVVTAGYFPDARDFNCMLYDTRVLECSWTYYSSNDMFQLFYTDHNRLDGAILLCTDNFSRLTSICSVNEFFSRRRLFYTNHNVTFTLMTCNLFVCNNQTFKMNTNSFTQLSPLKCEETNGSVLVWENCKECVYKVLFRLSAFGDRWQKLNTSSVHCGDKNCEFELILPYPDTKYEVIVKTKHKEVENEKLWSKPCLVILNTRPRENCSCDAQELVSTEKASCEACELTEDIIKKSLELRKRITSLKEKLDKITMLSVLLSRSREISDRIKDLE